MDYVEYIQILYFRRYDKLLTSYSRDISSGYYTHLYTWYIGNVQTKKVSNHAMYSLCVIIDTISKQEDEEEEPICFPYIFNM